MPTLVTPPTTPRPAAPPTLYNDLCAVQAHLLCALQGLSPPYTVTYPLLRLSKALTSQSAYRVYYLCLVLRRSWTMDYNERRSLVAWLLWGSYVGRLWLVRAGGRAVLEEWKRGARQPRPYNRYPVLVACSEETRKTSFSFPSQSAFTLGLCYSELQWQRRTRTAVDPVTRRWLHGIDRRAARYLRGVAALLAYTRFYRGLHYPHDLCVSYGMAGLVVWLLGWW